MRKVGRSLGKQPQWGKDDGRPLNGVGVLERERRNQFESTEGNKENMYPISILFSVFDYLYLQLRLSVPFHGMKIIQG